MYVRNFLMVFFMCKAPPWQRPPPTVSLLIMKCAKYTNFFQWLWTYLKIKIFKIWSRKNTLGNLFCANFIILAYCAPIWCVGALSLTFTLWHCINGLDKVYLKCRINAQGELTRVFIWSFSTITVVQPWWLGS